MHWSRRSRRLRETWGARRTGQRVLGGNGDGRRGQDETQRSALGTVDGGRGLRAGMGCRQTWEAPQGEEVPKECWRRAGARARAQV